MWINICSKLKVYCALINIIFLINKIKHYTFNESFISATIILYIVKHVENSYWTVSAEKS